MTPTPFERDRPGRTAVAAAHGTGQDEVVEKITPEDSAIKQLITSTEVDESVACQCPAAAGAGRDAGGIGRRMDSASSRP